MTEGKTRMLARLCALGRSTLRESVSRDYNALLKYETFSSLWLQLVFECGNRIMRIQNLLRLGSTILLAVSLAGCNENESTAAQSNSKVFKTSGVLQCQPDSGVPLEDMQMELVNASIDVVCAQVGGDGIAYPSLCGLETGIINVYEIRTVNLGDADALGFASVMTLPGYIDQVCE